MTKVVLLIGGPSTGTRFRPLSLERAKPMFMVAGHPLVWHHLKACTKLPNLTEVILLGFYTLDAQWSEFLAKAEKELGLKIRYLKEETRLGTFGGINHFRNEILSNDNEGFFVMHCDIVCSFPLVEIWNFHKTHGREITILGKRVEPDEAHKYGCLAINDSTNEVLHYAEKPETFINDVINCGVYYFSPSIFELADKLPKKQLDKHHFEEPHYMQIEQDILVNVCGEQHVYVYQTEDFWLQIKSAGMIIKCSELLLNLLKRNNPEQLAKSSKEGPTVLGNVLIHPTAKIDPSAKLGPNVSIGENVVIGAGVRVAHSIILDKAQLKSHSCVLNSVVGWDTIIGEWTRLEGSPDYSNPDINVGCGMTILGNGVKVVPEVIIRSCIVLPHKDLAGNHYNQILL